MEPHQASGAQAGRSAPPGVAIVAAGTGGHIYPALAVAEALKRLEPEVAVWFLTTRRGLGPEILARHGQRFTVVVGEPAPRRLAAGGAFTFVAAMVRGAWQARAALRRHGARALLATGGYGSAPAVAAARTLGLPIVWQEQNALPGRATRLLARWARVVALGFEEAARELPPAVRSRVQVTGNPIRRAVAEGLPRAEAARRLGLDPARRTVLMVGASQGARRLNEALVHAARELAAIPGVQVLASTGRAQFEATVALLRQHAPEATVEGQRARLGNVTLVPYLEDMAAALSVADLAISRAGAISLAELTARGLALVLVPYPHAADRHQDANARVLERAGAAVVVPDAALDARRLVEVVRELLADPARMAAMSKASRGLGRPQAAEEVARLVLRYAVQSRASA